jgi:hypothetical protein
LVEEASVVAYPKTSGLDAQFKVVRVSPREMVADVSHSSVEESKGEKAKTMDELEKKI